MERSEAAQLRDITNRIWYDIPRLDSEECKLAETLVVASEVDSSLKQIFYEEEQ
ncbi:hypothetical protein KIN20_023559 [Parelaphostrongylus tenuis]|uniref:Uncharacterized protein n=1 Tax=Parelaphostrongylus tenuis TaxID=148309 RepID=A0AAD5NC99_PARTN|nr:hypothetical protein KIN20_023559 [Parelaphostrongylus tenuis]